MEPIEGIDRILVVDDEPAELEAARRSTFAGEVLVESDARVVEARVGRDRPKVVVLDQWLGDGIRGHDVADALKERDPAQIVLVWSSRLDAVSMKFLLTRCEPTMSSRRAWASTRC